MTQEYKELLLKDLCARLPYCGLICQTNKGKGTLISIERSFGEALVYVDFGYQQAKEFDLNEDDEVKPYLRPMLTMTDEEDAEYRKMLSYASVRLHCTHYDTVIEENIPDYIDWLNAHHFDYRGLIDKGLAIAVTDENNPYK